jgi:isoleucyl-tRNA synthetase
MLPLWSTWYFFSLYANASGDSGYTARWRTDSTDVLDRYLLAKTRDLVESVTEDLEQLDSTLAAAKLRDFADVLTNWYVRRSRDRFWAGADAGVSTRSTTEDSTTEAFDTLYTVLETLTRVAAPLLPLVSERIWQGLTGGRSVHLVDWPNPAEFPANPALVAAMDQVRVVSSTVLSLRKQAGLRVRLPLRALTVVTAGTDALAEFEGILRDELNVKQVNLVELGENSAADYGITSKLTVNARAAGPRLGKAVQQVIQAARAADWSESDGVVTAGGIELAPGEYDLELSTGGAAVGVDVAAASGTALALLPGGGFVLLDTTMTPELQAEGLARDVIRAVQDTRKAAGFDVSDRIRLDLVFDDEADAAAIQSTSVVDIAAETLATRFAVHARAESSNSDALPSEWLEELAGSPVEHYASFGAGQYANRGSFLVAVARENGLTNV